MRSSGRKESPSCEKVSKKNLLIRADADARIGTGHLMRCLALAQAWQAQGGQVRFVTACPSDGLRQRVSDEGFQVIALEHPYPDPADWAVTSKVLAAHPGAWVVLDGYHFDPDYQRRVKEVGHGLLVIDDTAHLDHYYADVVLNQNIHAGHLAYSCEPHTRLLLGTRYVLLRREFWPWRGWRRQIPETACKVLVTLGGADPDNVTLKIIQALKEVNVEGLEARIVVGPANPNFHTLVSEICNYSDFHLITGATNMPELMAWADVAVSAGGSTCWEILFMGLPNLVTIFADNQLDVAVGLGKSGLSINAGWYNDVSARYLAERLNDLMRSSTDRIRMTDAQQCYVDGKGCERIIKAIWCEDILLRRASIQDCELLFKWVNEPDVRRSAFWSDTITFDEHEKWYREKLNDINVIQFIAVNHNSRPIGQIRFDIKESGESEVDVSVAKEFRGFGYGACLIRKGVDAVIRSVKIKTFNASIKSYNQASIKSFMRAGFVLQGSQVIKGQESIQLVFHRERS